MCWSTSDSAGKFFIERDLDSRKISVKFSNVEIPRNAIAIALQVVRSQVGPLDNFVHVVGSHV